MSTFSTTVFILYLPLSSKLIHVIDGATSCRQLKQHGADVLNFFITTREWWPDRFLFVIGMLSKAGFRNYFLFVEP